MILAGGAASRFGGLPKGLQTVGGIRIIDRIASALQPVTNRLLIVSNDPGAAGWIPEATVATDAFAGSASIIGIHSALAAAGGNVIVVGWDMPFVPRTLLAELGRRLTGDRLAVVPWGPEGPEPACAAYSSAALAHVERLVRAGALRLSAMVDALPEVDRVPVEVVARFGDPSRIFFNVNTPDDLRRAEAIASPL